MIETASAVKRRLKRNLNPHKPARLAMTMWGEEYAAQRGGSMEFWDNLSDSRKRLCREIVGRILKAPDEGDV